MMFNLIRASKNLSYLLRHGAYKQKLLMNEAGWVSISEILHRTRMTREELETVVTENNKARFQLDTKTDRIRCCQGHSLMETPVTPEALEASWEEYAGKPCRGGESEDIIWHGTNFRALLDIRRDGLLPMNRTHVHLAEDTDSKVGKRTHVEILLGVSRAALKERGLLVFRSPNGVLLVRRVPRPCILVLAPGAEIKNLQERLCALDW